MDTQIGKFLESIGGGVEQAKPDKLRTEPLRLDFNDKDVEIFNRIYKTLNKSYLRELERTQAGTIKKNSRVNRMGAWDVIVSNVGATITARIEGWTFSYVIGHQSKSGVNMTGSKAFAKFVKKCEEQGIDLDSYKIDNGAEVKKTIEPPKIYMKYYMDKTNPGLKNCHHIDFHNSYPAGLCNTHPEFTSVIEPLYLERKIKPENKLILNSTIGYMQSLNCCGAKWAHLSKDAIEDNNRRIDELSARLEASGRTILGYNTDGIWYQGDIYHGEGEGPCLGCWENDHVNCWFRSKSNGCYEFMEDGEYHPVVRGLTKLDMVKDRKDWMWGDIYTASEFIFTYKWDFELGFVKEEINE